MDILFLCVIIFLFLLAVFDLSVGVSNDAVNFLNSAIGSKAASFKRILIVASIGVFVGAAYVPFGLTYRFESDEDGALRMTWNGKPVCSLSDAEKDVLIANSLRGLSLGPDAVDLEAVYENGGLAGLREAQTSDLPETVDAEAEG